MGGAEEGGSEVEREKGSENKSRKLGVLFDRVKADFVGVESRAMSFGDGGVIVVAGVGNKEE